MTAGYVDLSGTGDSLISATGGVNGSTLLGGAGADTLNLTNSGVTNTRVIAGAGNDIVNFSGYSNDVTGASIVGGTGNDSVTFAFTSGTDVINTGSLSNTYFFGSSGGLDTISFSNVGTGAAGTLDLTIAVDSSYGATSGMTFSTSTSLITFSTGAASIFVSGLTGLRLRPMVRHLRWASHSQP